VTAALALSGSASAQLPEYQAKAEFLERFTRFIEWPPDAGMADLSAPFVTCVLGRDPFGSHLDTLAQTRRIKGKPVRVRRLEALADVAGCHLLFVATSEAAQIERVVARTSGTPLLTIGDTRGFAKAGLLINFVAEGERIAFEVNESEVHRSGLQFNSRLMSLARVLGASR
jgi:hypothetical protein